MIRRAGPGDVLVGLVPVYTPDRSTGTRGGHRLKSKNRDGATRRTCRADDRQRDEHVGKDVGVSLHEPFKRHAFVKIYSVLHYQVLMAGMEELGVGGRH